MNTRKVDFYQEVIVKSSYDNKKYIGKKGVVLGISEENGVIYGYAIFFPSEGNSIYIERDHFETTGIKFKKEDFY